MKMLFAVLFFFSVSSFAEFKIISRAEWNAEAAKTARMMTVDPLSYKAVTLHFPVAAELNACDPLTILSYQKKWMSEQGLPDLPFQFLIDHCGNIYQGQDLSTLPLHAGSTLEYQQQKLLPLNPNFQNIGIALLSRSASEISTAQQAAAVWLVDHLRSKFSIQSLMEIEQLQRSVELCNYHYVANGYVKTTNSFEQIEAAKKIQNFFKDVLQMGRHNSLCITNY